MNLIKYKKKSILLSNRTEMNGKKQGKIFKTGLSVEPSHTMNTTFIHLRS